MDDPFQAQAQAQAHAHLPPTKPAKRKRPSGSQQVSSIDVADNAAHPSPGASAAEGSPTALNGSGSTISNFRNVSACNRCRVRKNRCDQKLPACSSCEKAGVKCVGYDPVSKREIPRSYVYYLESRVQHLEALLQSHDVAFPPAQDLAVGVPLQSPVDPALSRVQPLAGPSQNEDPTLVSGNVMANIRQQEQRERDRLNSLVSNIGMVSVHGASDSRYLGSTSGISFARVVFAAVKSSVSGSGAASERAGVRPSKPLPGAAATGGGSASMRDSFFGLHTKPTIKPAPFPDKEIGHRLVQLYFEHANPQVPILHRGEFMTLVDRVYASEDRKRTARELYMLNIVFAIGSGIIMDSSDSGKRRTAEDTQPEGNRKRQKLSSEQHQPEEYHASAIVHLESFLGSSPAVEGVNGGLEELQAVLLLAGFALLRPVAPGLWYIIGVAVRLGIDLGLHFEDQEGASDLLGEAAQSVLADSTGQHPGSLHDLDFKERGRRQWSRDLRRRLWWCVYSLDRLVSTCVGRPFGITDQAVTTEFPSLLDDKYITPSGFTSPSDGTYTTIPSYKHVSHHYFRLRLLQSEILQVLQHRQAQQARANGVNAGNRYMHTTLPSPFLVKFTSFGEWRMDVDRRLWEWKESTPTQTMTGVQFTPLFLDLNYWQAVIMLYRQSLSVPSPLAGELDASTGGDVHTPGGPVSFENEEDEEKVFLKVAEAGQKVLKIYRQLHRVRLVNYTYLATHHLFMCGISFLYAIWHSTTVRSKLTLDDVDFTVLAATSVLGDLIDKCPPAEACRDAFERMSKATISMCMSTTGFGSQAAAFVQRRPTHVIPPDYFPPPQQPTSFNPYVTPSQQPQPTGRRPPPRFDMDLRDLFSDDDLVTRPLHPPMKSETSSVGFSDPSPMGPPRQSPQLFKQEPILQMTPPGSRQSPSQPQFSFQPSYQSVQPGTMYPTNNTLDNLDFLDDFSMSANAGDYGDGMANNGAADWDIGFGANGLAFDGGAGASWTDHGGFDLFDGFFFGGGATGGGAGGM